MPPRDRGIPRPPRDQRGERLRDGERPLLQGHLKSAKHRGSVASGAAPEAPGTPEPAAAVDQPAGPEAKGKKTKSPAATVTRRHLEGAEQGPA
jgi:hypothetical protein